MPDENKKPPNGYERPKDYKGPHRSDPDFGRDQNPATVGKENPPKEEDK